MPRKQAARDRLFQIQLKLNRQIQREAEALLGKPSLEISRYSRALERDFLPLRKQFADPTKRNSALVRKWSASQNELVHQLKHSEIILMGDYHPFGQSQRTALRILRSTHHESHPLQWLGLEMISSKYQKHLDAFQAGTQSLALFLKKIRYTEEWGFPWEHYAPLFEWAKKNRVRLLALNRPSELTPSHLWLNAAGVNDTESDLTRRDQWAAGVVMDHILLNAQLKAPIRGAVLYGELHLASQHLPAQIQKLANQHLGRSIELTTLHQNHEKTWWDLARRRLQHETRLLRLNKASWCLFSASPWSRTQALLRFAEEGNARIGSSLPPSDIRLVSPIPFDEDLHAEQDTQESHFDALGQIARWQRFLAHFFGLEPKELSRLTLLELEDESWFHSTAARKRVAPGDLQLMKKMVKWKLRFLDRRTQIAWIPELTENALAETAAIALLDDRLISTQGTTDLERLFLIPVFEYAFGFLGSLLINPRRKCELPGDHLHRLKILQHRGSRRGIHEAFTGEKFARKIAAFLGDSSPRSLQDGLQLVQTILRNKKLTSSQKTQILRMASRWSGRILAAQAHEGLTRSQLELERIKEMFEPEIHGVRATFQQSREQNRLERLQTFHQDLSSIRLPHSKSAWF